MAVLFTRRTLVAAMALMPLIKGGVAHAADPVLWRRLAPGLEHGQAVLNAEIGDRELHIVRIDPAHFRFELASVGAIGGSRRTARRWAEERGFSAVINAGMFKPDGAPVGYAKADGRVIQPHLTKDRSVFTFNARQARLVDRTCETFDPAREDNALQGIRMLGCDGRNVWAAQPRRWSIAAIAQDKAGRILFLHSRSPLMVHDFIDAMLALPLAVTRAMYQEGGPEATLYVNAGGFQLERFGSFETGFNENDGISVAWPLPNVFGIRPRH
ncbi:MAG: phosphodiester glycosidase family protein [Alphaproteobacteria bacterium]|nr:phosphodiester glycosidase family protein [Alphaproteobacteria bacterium]